MVWPVMKSLSDEAKKIRGKVDLEMEQEKERKRKLEEERLQKKGKGSTGHPWTEEELRLLVKGFGKFPGGTRERYAKIAEFIGGNRTASQVLARVKSSSV